MQQNQNNWQRQKSKRRAMDYRSRVLGAKNKPIVDPPVHSLGYLGGSSVDLSKPDKKSVFQYRKNRIRFIMEDFNGVLLVYGISLGDLGLFHSKLRLPKQIEMGTIIKDRGRRTLRIQPDRVVITKTRVIPLCSTTVKIKNLAIALDMTEAKLWGIIHRFLNQ